MNYRDHTEVYKDFPELQEIAERLEMSQQEADEANSANEKLSADPASEKRKKPMRHPEYSHFTKYYKDGAWSDTVYKPRPGREEFETFLDKLLQSHKPEGMELILYPGNQTGKISFKKTFWLTPNKLAPAGAAELTTSTEEEEEESKGKDYEQLLGAIDERLAAMGEMGGKGNHNAQIQIMKLGFESQLKDITHKQELSDLKNAHAIEVNALKREIADQKDYIADLEEDIKEQDEELKGLELEAQKKRETPSWEIVATSVAKNALTGVLRTYPKITEALSGLSEDQQKKIWQDYDNQQKESGDAGAGGSDISFEPATDSSNMYDGVDADQAKGMQNIHTFCKGLPLETFKKIWFFFDLITNDNGELNEEYLDQAYALLNQLKANRK